MPQFDPTYFLSQVFWLAITFVLLYLLMARVALPRIAEVLEQRSERIANDLERAEMVKKEADAVVEAYEAALAKARQEAAAVLAQAGQEIAELSAKRQAEFSAKLADQTAAAEERIGRAKREAQAHVRDIAVDVASDIAGKLIGRAPDQQTVSRSVDGAMQEAR
ncbi:MAG: F0F1 ATP synthase subunit B family protein [Inquilinaceae bacterium]